MVRDIRTRARTILVRTDDGFAVSATAIAAFGAVVGVECVVGVTDAAETNICPQRPALDAEPASFEGTFEWHGECVPEEECHGRDDGKEQIGGELHLAR
jgi:hypothetical protein